MAFLIPTRSKYCRDLTGVFSFFSPFLVVVLLAGATSAGAGGQSVDEYHLKAAFLFNFVKFVDWPATAFKTPEAPFTICVLGHDPFGPALTDAVAGKVVAGRGIEVKGISDVRQGRYCQVLFVGSADTKALASILRETSAACTLTVGDSKDFAAKGGVIGFIFDGSKVRFEINLDAAEQEGLRISSKLLSLARLVRSEKASR
jgi:hypothetical protein